jgi:hypothetical protein
VVLLSTGPAFYSAVSKEYVMNRKERERRRNGMPVTKAIFVAGIAAVTLINFDGFASAQSDPQASPPADVQSTSEAPNGQVQPTFRVQPMLRDLPPGVAQTETKRTEAQKEFDKKLQICRIC